MVHPSRSSGVRRLGHRAASLAALIALFGGRGRRGVLLGDEDTRQRRNRRPRHHWCGWQRDQPRRRRRRHRFRRKQLGKRGLRRCHGVPEESDLREDAKGRDLRAQGQPLLHEQRLQGRHVLLQRKLSRRRRSWRRVRTVRRSEAGRRDLQRRCRDRCLLTEPAMRMERPRRGGSTPHAQARAHFAAHRRSPERLRRCCRDHRGELGQRVGRDRRRWQRRRDSHLERSNLRARRNDRRRASRPGRCHAGHRRSRR